MLFGKKYDDEEVECQVCRNKVKPIIKRNKLKNSFYGQRYSGLEKNILKYVQIVKQLLVLKPK